MYPKSYPSSTVASRRWSDLDKTDGQFFKLIEIPFSPFQNKFGDDDDDKDDEFNSYLAARRTTSNYGSRRQEYLRSYTFCKKQTMQEKVKSRLGRLKAAACAMVTFNYYSLPRRMRRMKEKLVFKSLRGPRSRAGPIVRLPLLQAACFRA